MPKAPKQKEAVLIAPIKMRTIVVNLVGYNFIMHRFAQKAWQELLWPSARKNQADLEANLKHNPPVEYRECFYRNRDPQAPTLFHLPRGMVTKAMAAAAIDIGGATKASIERLTSVVSPDLYLYGVPQIRLDMVRNSDMAHTPDVRTRPIFPRWAVPNVAIRYKANPLTDAQMLNLIAASGLITGYGDARQQKGGQPEEGGPFGGFRLANADDPEMLDIIANEGRAAQQRAYDEPEKNTETTVDLLAWFNARLARLDEEQTEEITTARTRGGDARAHSAKKRNRRRPHRKPDGDGAGGAEAVQ